MNSQQREDAADKQRRGFAPALPVGLSTSHNSPPVSSVGPADWDEYRDGDGVARLPSIEVAEGGNFGAIAIPRPASFPNLGGHRGKVKEFSPASRRRLQRLLASIDRREMTRLPLFITLTYPKEWTEDAEAWKTHLDSFSKRISRRFPDASMVWKLEFQKRGAPHYHLLVFNVTYISARWVAEAWNEIVAPGDQDHLKAGTEVRRVKSWQGVAHYAAKYMSKSENLSKYGPVGRYWGVHNRAGLPIHMLRIILTWRQAFALRRTVFRKLDKEGRGPSHRGPTHGASMFARYETWLNMIASAVGASGTGSFNSLPTP